MEKFQLLSFEEHMNASKHRVKVKWNIQHLLYFWFDYFRLLDIEERF